MKYLSGKFVIPQAETGEKNAKEMKNEKRNVRLTAIVITINRNGIRRMITRTSRILDGILMKECPSKYLEIERENRLSKINAIEND